MILHIQGGGKGKRCFVYSGFADVFQVVICVGVVLVCTSAEGHVLGSLHNSSWSNFPSTLLNLSLQFGLEAPGCSVTLLSCCLVWLCAGKGWPPLFPVLRGAQSHVYILLLLRCAGEGEQGLNPSSIALQSCPCSKCVHLDAASSPSRFPGVLLPQPQSGSSAPSGAALARACLGTHGWFPACLPKWVSGIKPNKCSSWCSERRMFSADWAQVFVSTPGFWSSGLTSNRFWGPRSIKA